MKYQRNFTKIFLDFDDKAKVVNYLFFYDLYKKWTEAFRVASDNGIVIFG
jgi:hypothetical protein